MPLNITRSVFICRQISVFSYIILPVHVFLVGTYVVEAVRDDGEHNETPAQHL